jgi:hypothetical protein
LRDPVSKNPSHKKRAGIPAQGEGPEFKPSTAKKKRIISELECPLFDHKFLYQYFILKATLIMVHFFKV